MAKTLSTLVVKVTADTVEVRQAFSKLEDDTKKAGDSFQKLSAISVAAGNVIGQAFTKAFSLAVDGVKALGNEFLRGIDLSKEYNSAMIGLIGVSNAYGQSADKAMAAARSLASDGLLTVGDSAKGLKNLLQTGFGLKEATDIMNVFKDSAVNGRQANFSYADSIVTATEGIKNMLSRNVDNVGITKNLSVIMKEHGFIMSDLTDKIKGAAARQALYTGLLHEAAAAAGDAARSLGTYAGASAALDSSYKGLLASLGDFVTLNKTVGETLQFIAKFFREQSADLERNKKGYFLVSDAIIFLVRSFADLLNVADIVQTVFTALQNAFNDVAKVIANLAILILKAAEKALEFQAAMNPGPIGNFFSNRATDAKNAITFLEGALTGFDQATAHNIQREEQWGNKIQEVRAQATQLAKDLEKTRGQSILLGDVARQQGDKMKEANEKAAISAKELAKDLKLLEHAFALLLPAEEKHREAVRARLEQTMKDSQAAKLELINLTKEDIPQLQGPVLPSQVDFATPFQKRQKEFFKQQEEAMTALGKRLKEQAKVIADADPFGQAFRGAMANFGAILPLALANAFAKGDNIFHAAGEAAGNAFSGAYKKALERQAKAGGDFTASEKVVGSISAGITGALAGFDTGMATASKKKGALSGAATGAVAGLPLAAATGGISVAVGAAAGFFGGLIGGGAGAAKKRAEELQQLRDQKKALLDQFGGYDELKKKADLLGISIDKAFNAKTLVEFKAAMGDVTGAFAEQEKRMAALGAAVTAVNKKAELLAAPFLKLQEVIKKAADEGATDADKLAGVDAQKKMAESAQRSQQTFETLGLTVRDTFAGLVRGNGDAIAAITALGPAFLVLQQGVDQFGFTSTAVIDDLLANFRLLNDEAFKPLFDQIQADGEILKALFDAKALAPDTFQALAADIGKGIQTIVDKGGDMSRTLALSQPVLQQLWEAQKRYGQVTDETTQNILHQAEEQGLVGDQFKEVNEKILDVLLAIAKVLKADIPEYFKGLVPAADAAATGVENAFNNIKPKVHVKVEVDDTTLPDGTTVPALAGGGIVRRRTLAIIGENGPEAVVPLTGNSSLGVSGGNYVTDVYLDGERIARSTAKRMPSVLRGVGIS